MSSEEKANTDMVLGGVHFSADDNFLGMEEAKQEELHEAAEAEEEEVTDGTSPKEKNRARQNKPGVGGLSLASERWDLKNKGYLTSTQNLLRRADTDGTGALTADQLREFVSQHTSLKAKIRSIRRLLSAATLLIAIFFAGGVVATVFAVRGSKDTSVSGVGIMTAKDSGVPIAVNTNEVTVPLAALAFLPDYVATNIEKMRFMSEDGNTMYHHTVVAVDVTKETRVEVSMATGATAIWEGGMVNFNLKDGTAWDKCPFCEDCAATNVIYTEEVLSGLQKFKSHQTTHGRHLQQCDSHDPTFCDQYLLPSSIEQQEYIGCVMHYARTACFSAPSSSPSSAPSSKDECVILYQHANKRGGSDARYKACAPTNLAVMPDTVPDNTLSFIHIGYGFRVTLYDENNFGGNKLGGWACTSLDCQNNNGTPVTLGNSNNDMTRSIKIEQAE